MDSVRNYFNVFYLNIFFCCVCFAFGFDEVKRVLKEYIECVGGMRAAANGAGGQPGLTSSDQQTPDITQKILVAR